MKFVSFQDNYIGSDELLGLDGNNIPILSENPAYGYKDRLDTVCEEEAFSQ